MMSRHQLRLACGGLDIICASCYEVVKGESIMIFTFLFSIISFVSFLLFL